MSLDRRPARGREDDALHRPDGRLADAVRAGARRHRADPGRAARADRRGRELRQDDAGHGQARRPARPERGRSRGAAEGRRPDRRAARLRPGSGSRPRPGDDRARARRRRPRPRREAPRAGAHAWRSPATRALREEVGELERILAHVEAGDSLSAYERELPPALEPLTTKPVVQVVNGATAASTSSWRPSWPSSRPRRRPSFATGPAGFEQRARRTCSRRSACSRSSPAGDKETRAWTLGQGSTALDAAATIHTDIARGFIRCEVIAWRDLVEAGSRAEAARRGQQRLEGKDYVVADGDILNIRFNV